jgi:prepilin-type N-terminal cleavage/methylation domain-containing protein
MSKRFQRGFSLVELMCALLILGIGIVGLTEGITTALASSKDTERQSAAALLAAGQIELLRAEGYLLEGETDGEFEGELSIYNWRQTVDSTEIPGLFEVTVLITQSNSGQEVFELKTMLFDPPIARDEETEKREGRKR